MTNRKRIAMLLALVFLTTASFCDKPKIRQAREAGAAASISIGKAIDGLKPLNEADLITDTQERAALDFLDRVNGPLLEAGKILQGVNESTWGSVKGAVLAQVDLALVVIESGGSLAFKSAEAKATFNALVSAAKATILTFRNSLAAIK